MLDLKNYNLILTDLIELRLNKWVFFRLANLIVVKANIRSSL
jgi:hypothetical protein